MCFFLRFLFFFIIFLQIAETKESLIPKIIHFIHLEKKELSKEEKNAIRSWQSIHPDWTIKLWTKTNPHLKKIRYCPVKEETDFKKLRSKILQKEGGIWIHLDLIGCKSLDPLVHSYVNFVSFDKEALMGCAPFQFDNQKQEILPKEFILKDQVFQTHIEKNPLSGCAFWKFKTIPSLTETLRNLLTSELKETQQKLFLSKREKNSALLLGVTLVLITFNLLLGIWWISKLKKSYFIPIAINNFLFKCIKSVFWILCFGGSCFLGIFFLKDKENPKHSFFHANGLKNRNCLDTNSQKWMQLYEKIYQKGFSKVLKPTQEIKIPHVIHFIWGGEKPFPEKSIQNIASWMKYHPDWTFKFWTDSVTRPSPIDGMEKHLFDEIELSKILPFFLKTKNWGEKSDLLRYLILDEEGGLYVDHDIECFQSFHSLNGHFSLYAGIEPINPTSHEDTARITNCLIGAKPHHPVFQTTFKELFSRWDQIEDLFPFEDRISSILRVLNRSFASFYIGTTQIIENQEDGIFILPAPWIFPFHFPSSFREEIQSQGLLFANHQWDNSWFVGESPESPKEDSSSKNLSLLKRLDRTFYFNLFLSALFCLFLLLRFSFKKLLKRKTQHTHNKHITT